MRKYAFSISTLDRKQAAVCWMRADVLLLDVNVSERERELETRELSLTAQNLQNEQENWRQGRSHSVFCAICKKTARERSLVSKLPNVIYSRLELEIRTDIPSPDASKDLCIHMTYT